MDTGMIVDHVGVCVTDLERSIKFYRDFLGLKPVGRRLLADNTTEQVAYRMGEVIFILFHRSGFQSMNSKVHAGLDHIAFTVDGKLFETILAKVQERDLLLRGPYQNLGAQGTGLAMYFFDPDKNQIEIKTYDPDLMARYTEWDKGPLANRELP